MARKKSKNKGKSNVVQGQPKPSASSNLSVEDKIRQVLAYNVSKTKVPLRYNEILDFEEIFPHAYKVTLDPKYKTVKKLQKAMEIEFIVYVGASLPYQGEEIIMIEGQDEYVTPPVYGFSTVMFGKTKRVPSAFIMYDGGKEAEKTDKLCALSLDNKVYNR